jgi:hypothetical protein
MVELKKIVRWYVQVRNKLCQKRPAAATKRARNQPNSDLGLDTHDFWLVSHEAAMNEQRGEVARKRVRAIREDW